MRLHGNGGGRLGRLALAMVTTAALAVTLAACSGSGSNAPQTTATESAAATHGAASPATGTKAPAKKKAASGPLSGRWNGQYSGAFSGTFVLHWRESGSRLSGTIHISSEGQSVPIHGSVAGGNIRFGTVGSTEITYTGSVSGDSMSGNYQVHSPNGSSGGPWHASRA